MTILNLSTDVSLQDQNTLAIPAIAAHYVSVATVSDLQQALQLARERNLDVLVLGGGSNVVLPDRFAGLVIQVALTGIQVVNEDDKRVRLRAGAGENWHGLVRYCLDAGYYGLENLSLIPGTVGAAPMQNIGAYGVELSNVFESLSAVERHSGEEVQFDSAACEFGYRDSVFKNRLRGCHVISDVTLRLHKHPQPVLTYPALQQAIKATPADQLTPRAISDLVCAIRRSKLPDPATTPNAGSFFKNPIVEQAQADSLRADYPALVSYPVGDGREKLAAGWLLDQAGWRGRMDDGVGLHELQALVMINPGKRPAAALLAFADSVRADIRQRFGVDLEMEPIVY